MVLSMSGYQNSYGFYPRERHLCDGEREISAHEPLWSHVSFSSQPATDLAALRFCTLELALLPLNPFFNIH